MEGIQTFKGSWPWPWPWIRPYGIPSCSTHRPLPIYQISLKLKKLFVDGRTDGRTDIFPPLILLGRLLEVDLIKPKLKRQQKWKYQRKTKTKMILKTKKLRWWCVTSKNWTGSKLKSINSETINTSHLSYLFNIQCRHCRCMLTNIIAFITWAKFINKSPLSSCQSKKD